MSANNGHFARGLIATLMGDFLLPELAQRLGSELPGAASVVYDVEDAPAQQLDALTNRYVAGDPLQIGRHVKPLVRHKGVDGIWYFKTPDIRMFGWFVARDYFVATCFGFITNVKISNLYHGLGGEAVYYRNRLPLDEPKFVPGDDPNAVISNFSYPA